MCGAPSSTAARFSGTRAECLQLTLTQSPPSHPLPCLRGRGWEGAARSEAGEGVASLIAPALLGYLLGAIPFGLVLTRLAGRGDIRRVGSGNIGATNVLRTGSKGLAALTLLLDLAKGTVAVVIARRWGPQAGLIAAGCAILGHMFPVWLGFRGGKGVATALGVLIPLAWPAALVAALLWLLTAVLFHYSSLAALVGAVAGATLALFTADRSTALVIAGIALLIVLRHSANIRRLLAGTESRISLKKS